MARPRAREPEEAIEDYESFLTTFYAQTVAISPKRPHNEDDEEDATQAQLKCARTEEVAGAAAADAVIVPPVASQ